MESRYTNWFCKLFGFTERDISHTKIKDMFEYNYDSGILLSKSNNKKFIAGKFETPTQGDLRTTLDLNEIVKNHAHLQGKLTVKQVNGDVTKYHNKEENRFSVFQGAGQFNCLEFASAKGKPENGISCYAMDHTQGPACATTCAAGTIIRNYFAYKKLDKDNKYVFEEQQQNNQINCLELVEEIINNKGNNYFTIQNGYTDSKNEKLQELNAFMYNNPDITEKMKEAYKAGIQFDTEVVATNFGANIIYEEDFTKKLLVTQVYCSAISISYSRASSYLWSNFAKWVLDCAYEYVFYATIQNAQNHPEHPSAKKVYLTSLGGGVFGNKHEWIRDAILKAATKFKDIGLEVYIVNYSGKEDVYDIIEQKFSN